MKLAKFLLKYFHGAPTKIYLHRHLTHEYFHALKFPNLRYSQQEIHRMCMELKACANFNNLMSANAFEIAKFVKLRLIFCYMVGCMII